MIGEQVGSYRVTELIGTGGMGVVYLAEHPLIGQRAAVKILLPQLSHDREVIARFFNEARAAALIKHPGIVSVIDFGYLPGGEAFLVMEHLDGETLAARIEGGGPLVESRAVRIAIQTAGAIAAAHRKGIVHRDLKPENIFLVPDPVAPDGERVKILDFGIAKLSETSLGGRGTRSGHVIGSPHYMAPEQCRGGGDVDARADIYSLGCVLFEMIAGCPPFDGKGAGDIIARQIYEAPPALRSLAPDASPELEALIARTLAKEPNDRPQTMDELGALLGELGKVSELASTQPRRSARRVAPSRSPTTLGSSASELRPRARRGPLLLASAGAILLLGAGGVAAMMRWRAAPEAAPAAAAPAPAPARPAPSPPTVEPIVAPPPAPAPELATLTVRSTPPGATVLRRGDGLRLGVTPFTQREPRAPGSLELIVRKSGYRDARVSLPTDRDGEVTVTLRGRDPLDPYAQ